jgi:hypothetical protein
MEWSVDGIMQQIGDHELNLTAGGLNALIEKHGLPKLLEVMHEQSEYLSEFKDDDDRKKWLPRAWRADLDLIFKSQHQNVKALEDEKKKAAAAGYSLEEIDSYLGK